MAALVALVSGAVAGAIVVLLLQHHRARVQAERLFERWAAHEAEREVRRAVDRERAGTKQRLGADLAPQMPRFPFEAADARFLGHPAHFVVFGGHTDVKDRHREQLSEIVFVTLRSGALEPPDAWLVDECVSAGRVRWATLRPGMATTEGAGKGGADARTPRLVTAADDSDAPP